MHKSYSLPNPIGLLGIASVIISILLSVNFAHAEAPVGQLANAYLFAAFVIFLVFPAFILFLNIIAKRLACWVFGIHKPTWSSLIWVCVAELFIAKIAYSLWVALEFPGIAMLSFYLSVALYFNSKLNNHFANVALFTFIPASIFFALFMFNPLSDNNTTDNWRDFLRYLEATPNDSRTPQEQNEAMYNSLSMGDEITPKTKKIFASLACNPNTPQTIKDEIKYWPGAETFCLRKKEKLDLTAKIDKLTPKITEALEARYKAARPTSEKEIAIFARNPHTPGYILSELLHNYQLPEKVCTAVTHDLLWQFAVNQNLSMSDAEYIAEYMYSLGGRFCGDVWDAAVSRFATKEYSDKIFMRFQNYLAELNPVKANSKMYSDDRIGLFAPLLVKGFLSEDQIEFLIVNGSHNRFMDTVLTTPGIPCRLINLVKENTTWKFTIEGAEKIIARDCSKGNISAGNPKYSRDPLIRSLVKYLYDHDYSVVTYE